MCFGGMLCRRADARAVQGRAVPSGQIRRGLIRRLKELEQRLIRPGRGAEFRVRQHKFSKLCIVTPGGFHGVLRVPGGLRIGVGVKSRLRIRVSRPEAAAAALMRVGLNHDAVRAVGSPARMARSAPTGKARGSKIKAAPKEMYGALFTRKAAAKSLKDALGTQENEPTLMRSLRMVDRMFAVLRKGDGDRDLDGRRIDRRVNLEFMKDLHVASKEVRHGHRLERQQALGAIARLDTELMRYEVKLHLDAAITARHGGSRQSPIGEV